MNHRTHVVIGYEQQVKKLKIRQSQRNNHVFLSTSKIEKSSTGLNKKKTISTPRTPRKIEGYNFIYDNLTSNLNQLYLL